MKHLHSILLCLLLACSACTAPVAPPTPPEPPAPVVTGHYVITEFDVNGHAKHSWSVSSFRETQFPRSVTFDDGTQLVTLKGSYQIDQTLK